MNTWFTFAYGNVSRWIDPCRKCGRWYPRDRMTKDRICMECENGQDSTVSSAGVPAGSLEGIPGGEISGKHN
jgi:hypothetical protein